MGKEERARAK